MVTVTVRRAAKTDIAAINGIYNYYVANSTCTYQTEPATADERLAWFDSHDEKHPVTVAEAGGEVVGWASLSKFHARRAYENTVENSVYVRVDMQRKGVGRELLDDLIERARSLGHHTIIASISADQSGSIELHDRAGFVKVGHLSQVGYKFDTWLDSIFMQLML